MFLHPTLRLVPDNTKIRFMRGRFLGILVSAVLSTASIVLFFYPGLNLGIDFRGGIVIQARTPGPADFATLRASFAAAGLADAGLQRVGASNDVMISLESQASDKATDAAVQRISTALNKAAPGSKILGTSAVGPTVSAQLLRKGLLAVALSLVMILVYIWFRFEWEFAIGAVVTLLLDMTKTVGFLVVTRLPFDLVMVAAILTILGYSTNDKVVVYDRVRENLRKFKSMPLRELIDLSINETLSRTVGTSTTVFLAALPLALFGGATLSAFAWTMMFGIIVGTSSSIFIAAPILLFLGEHRLRQDSRTPRAAKPKKQPT
ncbi:MAG: protein translocase subunit SecF [Acetobacteraceae bacterium]